MFIIIMSRSSLKLGHVGSKTRSLGQILEILVYNFDSKITKLYQNVNDHNIKVKCKTGLCWVEN